MEENNVTEKKKNSGIMIVFFVILLIVLVLGGWFGSRYFERVVSKTDGKESVSDKEKDGEEEKEVIVTEFDINDPVVTGLFEGLDTFGTTMEVNNCGVLDFDYFRDTKVTISNLNKNTAIYVGLNHLVKGGLTLREGETFTKKQIHDVIEKVFGKDYKYVDEDIVNCPSITYDSASETYKVGVSGCGGSCGARAQKKVERAVKTDKEIDLYIRVVFVDNNGLYYSDFLKTNQIDVEYENNNSDLFNDATFKKGSLYKVVFAEEDGNYVFVSSEVDG